MFVHLKVIFQSFVMLGRKYCPRLTLMALSVGRIFTSDSKLFYAMLGVIYSELGNEKKAIHYLGKSFVVIYDSVSFQEEYLGEYVDLLIKNHEIEALKSLVSRPLPKFFYEKPQLFNKILLFLFNENYEDSLVFIEEALKKSPKLGVQILERHEIKNVSAKYEIQAPAFEFSFSEARIFEEDLKISRKVVVAESFLAVLKNIKVTAAFQITDKDKFIVYDRAADPALGFVAGCWNYYDKIKTDRKHCILMCHYESNFDRLESGILFSNRVSENYFHWMIEVMPKLLNLELANIPLEIPLILKSDLPNQFYQMLSIVAPNRKVFLINPNKTSLFVDVLYVPSTHTFHPDDLNYEFWLGCGLSYSHLNFIRQKVLSHPKFKTSEFNSKLKKVFLSRSGTSARGIVNRSEIESLFRSFGYQIVHPESMSFIDQVHLFHNADVIAGGGGAAFSNIIFCKPGTKIISLVHERIRDYSMFSNLAAFADSKYTQVLGRQSRPRSFFKSEEEYMHSDYIIDVSTMERCLNEIDLELIKV